MPSPAFEQTYQGRAHGPQSTTAADGLPRRVNFQTGFEMPMADARDAATGSFPVSAAGASDVSSVAADSYAEAGYKRMGRLNTADNTMLTPPDEDPFVTFKRTR